MTKKISCEKCKNKTCLNTYFETGKLCNKIEKQFLKTNNNGIKIYPSDWIRKRLSTKKSKDLKDNNIQNRTWREIPFSSIGYKPEP